MPVISVVVVAALLGVAAAAVLTYRGGTETTTGASSLSSTASAQSLPSTSETSLLSTSNSNLTLGLQLSLSVSNATIWRDNGLSVHISLNNTMSTQNKVSPPLNGTWLGSDNLDICSGYPIEVQIFSGNYSAGNLSEETPLELIRPYSVGGCPGRTPVAVTFAPLSGNITSPDVEVINQSAASVEYWGYWGGATFPPSNSYDFTSFAPGVYTVEGLDWWGQVAVLHFQVVANPDPLDCATISSNPAFVQGTNFSASAGPLELERYYKDLRSNNTVALELRTTGVSTLSVDMVSLKNPYTDNPNYVYTPFEFSPSSNFSRQTWQYYDPNGTLSEPAVFFPNECSLLLVEFPASYQGVPLALYVGGQTQTFTLNG